MSSCKFWLEDPKILFTSLVFLPNSGMDPVELLNVMTRLIMVITIALLLISIREWWIFLIVGILLIVAIWYFNVRVKTPTPYTRVEHFQCPRSRVQTRLRKITPKY